MEKTGKAVAWICFFSALLTGCYISELIRPTGFENEITYTGHIDYVLTEDGKKYQFDEPPVIANDTVVGGRATFTWQPKVNEVETSIPYSDVEWVGHSSSGRNMVFFVVTKASAKYTYEEPPTSVNGAYVGKATFTEYMPLVEEPVSIPLSNVAEISVSRLNTVKTLTWVGAIVAIAATAAVTAAIIADNFRRHFMR
jgi:hypothetical protein